jgi:hypothetical protein
VTGVQKKICVGITVTEVLCRKLRNNHRHTCWEVKVNIFQSVVSSLLLYGIEMWRLTEDLRSKIMTGLIPLLIFKKMSSRGKEK